MATGSTIFDGKREVAEGIGRRDGMTRERPKVNQEHRLGRGVKIVVDRKSIFACRVGISNWAAVVIVSKVMDERRIGEERRSRQGNAASKERICNAMQESGKDGGDRRDLWRNRR